MNRYHNILMRQAQRRIDRVATLDLHGAAPHPVVILNADESGLLTVAYDDSQATTHHMWEDVSGIYEGPTDARFGLVRHDEGLVYEEIKR